MKKTTPLPEGWPIQALSLYRRHEALTWRELKTARPLLRQLRLWLLFQSLWGLAWTEFPRVAIDRYLLGLPQWQRTTVLWALTRWLAFLKKEGQPLQPEEPELPGTPLHRPKRMKHRIDVTAPTWWPEFARQLYDEYLRYLRQRLKNLKEYLLLLHHFFQEQRQQGYGFREFPRRFLSHYLMNLKPRPRLRLVNALSSWMRFLYRRKELLLPLHEDLAEYRPTVLHHRPILSHDQVLCVLAQPDLSNAEGLRDRAFLEMAYATGLRLGELLALDLADVDLGSALIRVQKSKNDCQRNVPLTGWARHFLQRYLTETRPELTSPLSLNSLWLNAQGRRWRKYQVILRLPKVYRWRETVGFRFTMHLMRHACATHLLSAGAPLRHVQELLGHRDLGSTQIYTHLTPVALREQHRRCHPRFSEPFRQVF